MTAFYMLQFSLLEDADRAAAVASSLAMAGAVSNNVVDINVENLVFRVLEVLNDASSPMFTLVQCLRHFDDRCTREPLSDDVNFQEPGADHVDADTCLWKKHPHPRDARIQFESRAHRYTVDGQKLECSVTKVYTKWFEAFDGDATVMKHFMTWAKNSAKPRHVEAQFLLRQFAAFKDADRIQAIQACYKMNWRNNGAAAADEGTDLHLQIELFLNGLPYTQSKDFDKFLFWFENEMPKNHRPFRTEWNLWAFLLAGQADFIAIDEEGMLHIYDWKKTKHPLGLEEAYKGKTGFGPCCAVPDTHFGKYTVQLNIYKYFLEFAYGFAVKSMTLIQMHDEASKKAVAVPVPCQQKVASEILHDFDPRFPLIDGLQDEPFPTVEDECKRRGLSTYASCRDPRRARDVP